MMSDSPTRLRKKVLVSVLVILFVFAMILGYLLFVPSAFQNECTSASKFSLTYVSLESNLGRNYCISDSVVSAEVIIVQEIDFDAGNSTYLIGESNWTFTRIMFSSTSAPWFLGGNRTNEFVASRSIAFQLTAQHYEAYGHAVVMVEPEFVLNVLLRGYYWESIRIGVYQPMEIETYRNQTMMWLNVTRINDSYPLPLEWSDIQLLYWNGSRTVSPGFNVTVENESGILGMLLILSGESSNPELHVPVAIGQSLVFPMNTEVKFDKIDIESHSWPLNRYSV